MDLTYKILKVMAAVTVGMKSCQDGRQVVWLPHVCRFQVSRSFPASLLPNVITGAEEGNDSGIPGLRASATGRPAFLRASMNEVNAL